MIKKITHIKLKNIKNKKYRIMILPKMQKYDLRILSYINSIIFKKWKIKKELYVF